jgi:hypothetical protein
MGRDEFPAGRCSLLSIEATGFVFIFDVEAIAREAAFNPRRKAKFPTAALDSRLRKSKGLSCCSVLSSMRHRPPATIGRLTTATVTAVGRRRRPDLITRGGDDEHRPRRDTPFAMVGNRPDLSGFLALKIND